MNDTKGRLQELLRRRIAIIDGAMGTVLQSRRLDEATCRGERFATWKKELKGLIDLLNLTQPRIVEDVHREYLEAGADIIETNTFNAQAISLADYGLESLAGEISKAGAAIARRAADRFVRENPSRECFVAGSIGPTTRTASMATNVADAAARGVSFDELVGAYAEQARGLLDGGADILLVETIFDTLNGKAAFFALTGVLEERGLAGRVPIMASVTFIQPGGSRSVTGQTVEAFWNSVSHAPLFSVGLNCGLGPREMRRLIEEISRLAPIYVSAYPNAGLPDPLLPTGFPETPETMAASMREWAQSGFLNLAGGCCGTTPEHIRRMAESMRGIPPRVVPAEEPLLRLSGLDALALRPGMNLVNIGERTNVAGSPKFAKLVKSGDFEGALAVARQQVENGAQILDVCMDEAMIDGVAAMTRFLNLVAAEPDVARVPVMIDSSRWEVVEAGLKCLQGKGLVNSISLKEGEEKFLDQARLIRRYGAAAVVMAFDERGQAATFERKIEVCRRSYELLTRTGFPPQDIVLDPNILTVGTGMSEHADYGVAFIRATGWIKDHLPLAKVSGGISNVSFSFRGNAAVREAMNSAFLYHAVQAGLDMGIVNAGQLAVYEEIPKDLLDRVEDVLLNRRPDATERLVAFASTMEARERAAVAAASWRASSLEERLAHALIHGIDEHIAADIDEARGKYARALDIIEGPLMSAMKTVGDLFGSGKMFLPQVVKSARVMKRAVACLEPFMAAEKGASQGRVLLATVKGDVHDIGKNIVGVVLGCNRYEVIDLGVMVACDKILETAREKRADVIGLSGLITPSLDEMVHVAREMERQGFRVPLLIGGATTSRMHTAVKIGPAYGGPVVHVADAGRAVPAVRGLTDPDQREGFVREVRAEQERIRAERASSVVRLLPIQEARARAPKWKPYAPPKPGFIGVRELEVPLAELRGDIDWTPFFHAFELSGRYPDILSHERFGESARKLFADAEKLMDTIIRDSRLRARAVYGFFPANRDGDDVELREGDSHVTRLHFLRQQIDRGAGHPQLCLADYVAPRGTPDYLGAFALTAGLGLDELAAEFRSGQDDYSAILAEALADRLAEAFSEHLHRRVRGEWGCEGGIRPAAGYPACPDHSEKGSLWALLDVERRVGMRLTETFAMWPASSVSGLYFSHPDSRYFAVGKLGRDQVLDYQARKGMPLQEVERWLRPNLGYDSDL